jgi:hypothetical protein
VSVDPSVNVKVTNPVVHADGAGAGVADGDGQQTVDGSTSARDRARTRIGVAGQLDSNGAVLCSRSRKKTFEVKNCSNNVKNCMIWNADSWTETHLKVEQKKLIEFEHRLCQCKNCAYQIVKQNIIKQLEQQGKICHKHQHQHQHQHEHRAGNSTEIDIDSGSGSGLDNKSTQNQHEHQHKNQHQPPHESNNCQHKTHQHHKQPTKQNEAILENKNLISSSIPCASTTSVASTLIPASAPAPASVSVSARAPSEVAHPHVHFQENKSNVKSKKKLSQVRRPRSSVPATRISAAPTLNQLSAHSNPLVNNVSVSVPVSSRSDRSNHSSCSPKKVHVDSSLSLASEIKQLERRIKMDDFARVFDAKKIERKSKQTTSRELSSTLLSQLTGKPAFESFGMANVHPTTGSKSNSTFNSNSNSK